MARKINLCTETLHVSPESSLVDQVQLQYKCYTGTHCVMDCRYYEPFIGADGMTCPYECAHFNNGCTCVKARKAAHRRTERILRKLLEKTGK